MILVEPSHPGNIGATARAMKTMGLGRLTLVNPHYYPDPIATARASGAKDILDQAQVVSQFKEAVADCQLVIGTSSRARKFQQRLLTPRQAGELINRLPKDQEVAIVFGCERVGLTNEQLMACQYQIEIPANPDYQSLNLASAVQIIAYELYANQFQDKQENDFSKTSEQLTAKASNEEREFFYQRLEEFLFKVEFLRASGAAQVMQQLVRLFNRSDLEQRELKILHGIFSAIEKKLDH